MENRRLTHDGKVTYRLYKFRDSEEALKQVDIFKQYYKKSVVIEKWGNITQADINMFSNMCDDLAYMDLSLKVNDNFMLTKEITVRKLEDDKKIINSNKFHKVSLKTGNWTDEQYKHLWSGLPNIVAKIVNKSEQEVENERKRYIRNNPGFKYPINCKKPRKNAKVVIEKKPWVQSELDVLWKYAPKEMSLLLKRTVFEIHDKRREICLRDPNFVIPLSAKFDKKDLPNSYQNEQNIKIQNVKIQKDNLQEESIERGFWQKKDNTHILWNNKEEDICRILNKKPKAIYQARLKYLANNPGFVIPKASGFRLRNGTSYDFTYEKEDVAINLEDQILQHPQNVLQVESKQQLQTTNPEDTNITSIANLLNSLSPGSIKPKKITIGNITVEF